MSTSDHVIDTQFAKRLVLVSGLVPAALLLWDASRDQLGVNDVNFAIRTTGMVGLLLLTLSLVITPLRALTGWNTLIAVRRNLGVLGFFYVAAHFALFFLLDREGSVASTFSEIVMRRYLWFGTGALVLMIPLTLTSTDGMVVWLGAKRWKLLHRLAYAIAIGAVAHYYLLVKSDVRQPLAFAAVIGLLLGYRAVAHYVGLRKEVRAARGRAASAATGSATKRFWSGELTLVRIFDETHDVKTFRLMSADGGPLPFTHAPGQYLSLALTIEGRRVNRSYTIVSPSTRTAHCEISVKHVDGGYVSRYLHESWHEGQRVRVSAPAGRFVFSGQEAERVVLIAGGIGITPMMAIIRSLTDRGWGGEIYLLYSVRAVRDLVFRDELAYLQARFPNLRVRVTVTRDPDTPWEGLRGHVTPGVIADFIPELTRGPILLCGPTPMMAGAREILVNMGVKDTEILEEAFVSPGTVEASAGAAPVALGEPRLSGRTANIVFTRAGTTTELAPGRTVLEVAEAAGVEIPFECRAGICGQCKTLLISGQVTMDVQDALTASDRSKGLILACQARAIQDVEVYA